MNPFAVHVFDVRKRREEDAKRFGELDGDLCQICWAYGADKRSWLMECLYAVHEAIPEAIDLFGLPDDHRLAKRGYYLRLCKSCRGAFLTALGDAATKRRALRSTQKDHDGSPLWDSDPECQIPVRVNGATVLMNPDDYEDWRAKQKAGSE
ncbi:MAG: hypothetical protein FJZ00_01855 [Candidatus Sericytochromatia bacterium]|uniref:Uncharacterized protein n=1 Tax=Candidatus Tanganyikabacteria bacterium TaxID=2961651 RepID=A0A937X448_9BACT|nr:hypothetical protein [Candidatus Tanganyikabacteria bacterium]